MSARRTTFPLVHLPVVAGLILFLTASTILAQQPSAPQVRPGAMSSEESAMVSRGWTLLAEGRAREAATVAIDALTRFPSSHAAFTLTIEAEIAGLGSSAAITRYENWAASHAFEEPGILHSIARAMLLEFAHEPQNPTGQAAALEALALAGEPEGTEGLREAAESGNVAGQRALAALGDPAAVNELVKNLNEGTGNKTGVIEALGASRSQVAMDPLIQQLAEAEAIVRGDAADALGRLGNRIAVPRLLPLLRDPLGYVRVKAAGALLRLGDNSGLTLLTDLAADGAAANRIVAAEALSSKPDAAWLELVRELAAAGEPEIRLTAAKLIGPHDPIAARVALEELRANENPSIRDEAMRVLATEVPTDLLSLRALLRSRDRLVRIAAASKILTLTR